jgi:hypothetical protein
MSGSVRQFASSLARLALPLVIAMTWSGMTWSASPAAAALVDVHSVTGQWLSATPSSLSALQGLGTNEIRWGRPAENQQSGYRSGQCGRLLVEQLHALLAHEASSDRHAGMSLAE